MLTATCLAASLGAAVLHAQARLAFEVASVKRGIGSQSGSSGGFQPGGRYTAINARTDQLLRAAYPETRGDIVGVPQWVFTETHDVVASAGLDASRDEIRLMLRTLLEDRFKLRARASSGRSRTSTRSSSHERMDDWARNSSPRPMCAASRARRCADLPQAARA